MKSHGFEEIFPNSSSRERTDHELSEGEAEQLLDKILENPDNAFLTEMPQNRDIIENLLTYRESLEFAEKKIRQRLEATLDVKKVDGDHLEHIQVNPDSILNALESIRSNAVEIGLGADGRVVTNAADVRNINPETCYKFMIRETISRGRNSVAEEAGIQAIFFEAAQQLSSKHIGVPEPFFEVEVFNEQMIAMERLHARSVDDILRGIGGLPEWFDVDVFCDSFKEFIDAMHAQNLYHRDLHFGNVMISQRQTWKDGEPMGYVIDFGLSAYAFENMDPYKKEVAGKTFTYDDDYGRISLMRKSLKALQIRHKEQRT